MTASVFRAEGLTKRFGGKVVLDGLQLELEEHRVTVLLGPSGSGKTTLMHLALGVLEPDAGSMRIMGRDPTVEGTYVRQRIGYVPDKPDVYGWMTLHDLLNFLRPQYPQWSDERVTQLLDTLRIPLQTPFRHLSRGEGMQAMLVAALAPQPDLLLFDEPFAGLDPVIREEVLQRVLEELRQSGQTVLCSTHDLEIASRIAERVAILSNGRIVRHGTLEEMLEHHEPVRIPEFMYQAILASAVQKEVARC